MKNSIPAIFLLAVFLTACHSSEDSNPKPVPVDTVTSGTVEVDSSEFSRSVVNIPSLWKVESQDKSFKEKLIKPENNNLKQLSPQQLTDALNSDFHDIRMEFERISNDTIYVSIPESEILTNQSGDTGAYDYLATVVYNLTELNNVKYVNFKFKAGNHASPGTYSREDFKSLR